MVDEDVQPALANSIRSPKMHLQGFRECSHWGKAWGGGSARLEKSQQRSSSSPRISSQTMDKGKDSLPLYLSWKTVSRAAKKDYVL